MTVNTNTLEKDAVPPNAAVSLIRGGPSYRAQLKTRLY
jgi:hypothetical protein